VKGESRASELSEREKEVMIMLAWGYSNKEIAGRLNLSVKTVETYKLRIGEKLGLRSRTEMVQYALRQGWLNETHILPLAR
jgi:DNA-binding NarL/FixJ family response regulator